jgi:hypothetical protein
MTGEHASGTDRVAEVAKELDVDIVVNVQGDEPLIDPQAIEQALAPFDTDASHPISTLVGQEMKLLRSLLSKTGEPVHRAELHIAIRGEEWGGEDRIVDLYVSRLRKLLGDDAMYPRIIHRKHGVGYLIDQPKSQQTPGPETKPRTPD